MKKRLSLTLLLAAACSLLLSACGSSFDPVGSWYSEEDSAVTINLEKGGRMIYYDSDLDESTRGTWSQENDKIRITVPDGSYAQSIDLTPDGENTLTYEDGTLVRGKDVDLPAFSASNLSDYTWTDEDGTLELDFYSFDQTWEIYDTEEGELGNGDFTIDGDTIIMTDSAENKVTATLSDDMSTLTTSDDVVYHRDA